METSPLWATPQVTYHLGMDVVIFASLLGLNPGTHDRNFEEERLWQFQRGYILSGK